MADASLAMLSSKAGGAVTSPGGAVSEFMAECFMRLAYVSNFTGSAGTAIITKNKAALWTDGRYFLQAEKQLSSSWVLMRSGNSGVPTTSEWINDVLDPGSRIGIDPGHIAVDQAVFPENTPGFVLDAFARSFLWKIGLDYRHGTGHGVGAALNVHEGPQSISFRFKNTTSLQRGMVVSNEPGYYEDHSFGIRIENLLFVKEMNTPNHFGGKHYFGFEKLTFVPIQIKMIDMSLISDTEVSWINEYHDQVWAKVSPLVKGDKPYEWLRYNTRPLPQKPPHHQ